MEQKLTKKFQERSETVETEQTFEISARETVSL